MGEKKVIRLKLTGNTLVFYYRIAYHWLQHTQARPRRGPRTKPQKKPHVQLQKHKNARTKNAERGVQNAECRTQNAERKMQNAECRTQSAESRVQNAEY